MATANDIISMAIKYIGTKESPPNSNNVVFNTDYYGKNVAFRKGDDGKDLAFTREREREGVQPYFRMLVRPRLQG